MTKFREIVTAEYAKVKQLSAERKQVKAELNAAYAKYKKFMAETYKPGRKAAFEAIAKAKADRKINAAAKRAAAAWQLPRRWQQELLHAKKVAVKKAAPAAKKVAVKKAAPAAK